MTTREQLEHLREDARDLYYILYARLGDDKLIARELAKYSTTGERTILRGLESQAFRNYKGTYNFIQNAKRAIKGLDGRKKDCSILLLGEEDSSPLLIQQTAQLLKACGINNISAPQLIFNFSKENFLDEVREYIQLADFIVLLNTSSPCLIEKIERDANKHNKEIFFSCEIEEIKANATRYTIQKKEKYSKQNRSEYI